ncbi:MAG: hypothetical protein H7837_08110 [Magnetococcus sp. MYC-9]
MTDKRPPATPAPDHKSPEKPLVTRMQRLLAGQPAEDVILDPDNPNLIQERREKQQESSS